MSDGHVNLSFHVLNTLTKKDTCKKMSGFREDDNLASKIDKVKRWNCTTKTIRSFVKIRVHTLYLIVSQYIIPKIRPRKLQKSTRQYLLYIRNLIPQLQYVKTSTSIKDS